MNSGPAHRSTGKRVLLAAREPVTRDALSALLTESLSMEVVGLVDTAAALQREVKRQRPDLVVVAWNLIVASAESALEAMRRSSRESCIVVLGPQPGARAAAVAAGADGFISMVDTPDVVMRVLVEPQERHAPSTASRRRLEETPQ